MQGRSARPEVEQYNLAAAWRRLTVCSPSWMVNAGGPRPSSRGSPPRFGSRNPPYKQWQELRVLPNAGKCAPQLPRTLHVVSMIRICWMQTKLNQPISTEGDSAGLLLSVIIATRNDAESIGMPGFVGATK